MAMAEMSRDPRARRTLERLRGGMNTLMATKNLDQISVAELCREAGVHRTTFYKHFENVTAFATELFAGLVDEMALVDVEEQAGSVDEVLAAYRAATVNLLVQVAENRTTYRRLFGPHGDLVFQRIVADRLVGRTEVALSGLARRGVTTGVDDSTAAAMVGTAVAAALAVWAGQEADDVEARTEEILACLPAWWPRGG